MTSKTCMKNGKAGNNPLQLIATAIGAVIAIIVGGYILCTVLNTMEKPLTQAQKEERQRW